MAKQFFLNVAPTPASPADKEVTFFVYEEEQKYTHTQQQQKYSNHMVYGHTATTNNNQAYNKFKQYIFLNSSQVVFSMQLNLNR